MVRDRAGSRARELERAGFALHEGNVLRPESMTGAGRGVDVAYYLVHSMGRGGHGDFVASERAAAASFARSGVSLQRAFESRRDDHRGGCDSAPNGIIGGAGNDLPPPPFLA